MITERILFMKEMINGLGEEELEQWIGKRVSEKLLQDEIYLKDIKDAQEIESRLDRMGFTIEQKRVMNDYIACLNSAYIQMRDVAYLAGVEYAQSEYK